VRDALSLLDQAIAHGGGEVSAEQVRAMLGLADRGRVLDLFERVMTGDARGALAELAAQYAAGADPMAVLRDLAEVTHWISVVKIAPESAEDPTVSPDERARGLAFAERLGMRALTRAWQMLIKALEEVANAPNAMMAAEMALIRLTHVADLPTPEELVRRLSAAPSAPETAAQPAPAPGPGRSATAGARRQGGGAHGGGAHGGGGQGAASARQGGAATPAPGRHRARPSPSGEPAAAPDHAPLARFAAFEDILALIRDQRDMQLLVEVEAGVRLVRYAPGRIEFEPAAAAAPDLASRLAQRLQAWTGARWGVSVVGSGGAPTIAERRAAERDAMTAQAMSHPLVQAVLAAFPGAEIRDIRPLGAGEPPPPLHPEPGDDSYEAGYIEAWDPDDPFAEET
jgi:DNA polymerase III subunit gamma/tau